MHEIVTEITIDAPAGRVWQVLTDFAAHPQWNPFVRKIEGEAAEGSRLKVSIQQPGGNSMTFKPFVLKAEPDRELRWLGSFLLPGIFQGEHYFIIEALGPSRVRFIHGERFKGILAAMMKSGLDGGTRAGFEAMNQALKARAENSE